MNYRQALDFIWRLTDYERRTGYDYSASRFDLARVRLLMDRLAEPQAGMVLAHVAGTKGKGSTAAMLAAILSQAGVRAGLYTSPHLHSVRERIRIDGVPIGREQFAEAVERVEEASSGIAGLTSFEVLTATAFVAFTGAGVQTAVIEVGMGGRLDATNVIQPRVAVITSLSYDHTAYLGDTIEAIAGEKAGIIKHGIPTISAAQPPAAARVLRDAAADAGSSIQFVGADWHYRCGEFSERRQSLHVSGPPRPEPLADGDYWLELLGEHQLENATLALAASECLAEDVHLEPQDLQRGLLAVEWPGRFEVVHHKPSVVLDGAHNVDSMAKLIAAVRRHLGPGRLRIVFGASRDKDIAGMFALLAGSGSTVYACQSEHGRSASVAEVAAAARAHGLGCLEQPSVSDALWQAYGDASVDDHVLVTGSLFVVAAAREAIARRYGRVSVDDGEVEVVSLADTWRS